MPAQSTLRQYPRLWRLSYPGRAQLEISYHCKPAAENNSSAISYLAASSSSSGFGSTPAAICRPILVVGSTVSAYAEMWFTPRSMAVRTDVRQSSRPSPGAP